MNDRGRMPGPSGRGMSPCMPVFSSVARWMRCALPACLCLIAVAGRGADAPASSAGPGITNSPARTAAAESARKRADALRRVCERLGVGPGASIADVGAGGGADTFTFAEIVGPTGKVFSEEITGAMQTNLLRRAKERGLDQVVALLGGTEDPCLPDGAVDLVYMNAVFHHFAKPVSMLARLREDLKPGGFLVIVDREEGPQREWVDMAVRERKHYWTGETTVVRLAREAGFRFETLLDDLWHEPRPFVLVFRKPSAEAATTAGDPDLPSEIDVRKAVSALPPISGEHRRTLFAGVDRGRALLEPLRAVSGPGAHVHDVILEEWTTVTNERPAACADAAGLAAVSIFRTAKGDLPGLTNGVLHAAVFADAYSRLWDPAPLLRRLRASLDTGGYVAVLDRAGPPDEPRRLSGHRRRIAPGLVKEDLRQAGFAFVRELDPPAADRFFLLFQSPGNSE